MSRHRKFGSAVDRGTDQTRDHAKGAVIERMVGLGRMGASELTAARMLGGIWLELEAGYFGSDSTTRLALAGCSTSAVQREPIGYGLSAEYMLVYRPWRDEMLRMDDHRYAATYAVVFQNIGFRELENAWQMRHGVAFGLVEKALGRFDQLYRANFKRL